MIFPKIGTRNKYLLTPFLFNFALNVPVSATGKKKKWGMYIRKEEIKFFLFTDDMIV